MVFGGVTGGEKGETRRSPERAKSYAESPAEQAARQKELRELNAANERAAEEQQQEDEAKAKELAWSLDSKAYDVANDIGIGEEAYENAKVEVQKAEEKIASLQGDLEAVKSQSGGFLRRLFRGSNAEINRIQTAIQNLESQVDQLNQTVIGPVEGYLAAQQTPDRPDDGTRRDNSRLDAMRNRPSGGTGGFGRK